MMRMRRMRRKRKKMVSSSSDHSVRRCWKRSKCGLLKNITKKKWWKIKKLSKRWHKENVQSRRDPLLDRSCWLWISSSTSRTTQERDRNPHLSPLNKWPLLRLRRLDWSDSSLPGRISDDIEKSNSDTWCIFTFWVRIPPTLTLPVILSMSMK